MKPPVNHIPSALRPHLIGITTGLSHLSSPVPYPILSYPILLVSHAPCPSSFNTSMTPMVINSYIETRIFHGLLVCQLGMLQQMLPRGFPTCNLLHPLIECLRPVWISTDDLVVTGNLWTIPLLSGIEPYWAGILNHARFCRSSMKSHMKVFGFLASFFSRYLNISFLSLSRLSFRN